MLRDTQRHKTYDKGRSPATPSNLPRVTHASTQECTGPDSRTMNCAPFRPDSRHKQKGSSTCLRTCVDASGCVRRIFGFWRRSLVRTCVRLLLRRSTAARQMDYASSVHFRLTCCQHLSSIWFSEPRSNSSAMRSLDLHCCTGIHSAGCM